MRRREFVRTSRSAPIHSKITGSRIRATRSMTLDAYLDYTRENLSFFRSRSRNTRRLIDEISARREPVDLLRSQLPDALESRPFRSRYRIDGDPGVSPRSQTHFNTRPASRRNPRSIRVRLPRGGSKLTETQRTIARETLTLGTLKLGPAQRARFGKGEKREAQRGSACLSTRQATHTRKRPRPHCRRD